jgi:hypothetical protein
MPYTPWLLLLLLLVETAVALPGGSMSTGTAPLGLLPTNIAS